MGCVHVSQILCFGRRLRHQLGLETTGSNTLGTYRLPLLK